MLKRVLMAGLCAAALTPGLARADLFDWSVDPWTGDVGDAQLTVGGAADGTLFAAHQPAFPGLERTKATGMATLYANLVRTYDTGMVLALKSSFQIYRDK